MKKIFLLTISLCLSWPSAIICSVDNTPNHVQDTTLADDEFNDYDDYDQLVTDAMQTNVLPEKVEIKEPSQLQIMMQKIGILLFLKPYIFVVTKYRCIKKTIGTYIQACVNYFSRTEPKS